jgi:predicted O-methyltransferase YrrM
MDIRRFKEALVPLLTESSGDSLFSTLRIATKGMSGIRTAKIINFACRCMDENEFYLEVGTFAGYTLISAGYQSNAMCVGVDDFSLEDIVRPESRETARESLRNVLNKNLESYGLTNCKFIELDFRKVEMTPKSIGNLAVLFIDGKHTSQEVDETLAKFSPYLSKDAVLIFDDIQFNDIPKSLQRLWKSEEYEMLLYVVSTVNKKDETLHMNMPLNEYVANGICVMARKEVVHA